MPASMSRLAPYVLVLVPLALVWGALAQPAGSRSRIGSTEQAAEAIREFERNAALPLPEARPTPGATDWRFVVPAGPEYWVSRKTGRVWSMPTSGGVGLEVVSESGSRGEPSRSA